MNASAWLGSLLNLGVAVVAEQAVFIGPDGVKTVHVIREAAYGALHEIVMVVRPSSRYGVGER
jgi:hypothetical protein